MKDELGGNIMLVFVGLRAKGYAYRKLVIYPAEDGDGNVGDIVEVEGIKK